MSRAKTQVLICTAYDGPQDESPLLVGKNGLTQEWIDHGELMPCALVDTMADALKWIKAVGDNDVPYHMVRISPAYCKTKTSKITSVLT